MRPDLHVVEGSGEKGAVRRLETLSFVTDENGLTIRHNGKRINFGEGVFVLTSMLAELLRLIDASLGIGRSDTGGDGA